MDFVRRQEVQAASGLPRGWTYHVYEGGQGLAIQDDEDVEYGTPSLCGMHGVLRNFVDMKDTEGFQKWYVSRTYQVRHGAGRMDAELGNTDAIHRTYPSIQHNIENGFQGPVRYGGINANEMFRRIRRDHYSDTVNIVWTHANETRGCILHHDGSLARLKGSISNSPGYRTWVSDHPTGMHRLRQF